MTLLERARSGASVKLREVSGTSGDDGTRSRLRQPADALGLIASVVVVAALLFAAHSLPTGTAELTANAVSTFRNVPRVFVFACAAATALGTLVLVVALVVDLARNRRADALNAAVGAALAIVVGTLAVAGLHAFRGGLSTALLHGTDGSMLVRDGALVALFTGADVVRHGRYTRYCVMTVVALLVTGLALGDLTPDAVLIAPVAGYAIGLIPRVVFGTTVTRPSLEALRKGLLRSGVDIETLARTAPHSSDLSGRLADGTPVVLKAAGRETRGEGALRRLWVLLRLRGAALGHVPHGSRGELETEALASLIATNAAIPVPRVLLLADFEPDTLVLVRERDDGPALTKESPVSCAEQSFRLLRRLHTSGIGHRDLRAENLVRRLDGMALRSLDEAVVGAGELVRRLDVAQMLISLGSLFGAPAAVAALRAGYEPADERAIASIMQPIALRAWGFSAMRASGGCLAEVRKELLGEDAVEVRAARIERFRWRTVLSAAALTLALFLLVGQLSKVNLLGALRDADYGWFAVALVASAVTYFASSVNLVAFVPQKVSVLKGALVELAGAFVGLVTPPTLGHVAVNGRYLRRQGIDTATAAGAVGVSQVVNFLLTIGLLLVIVLLTGTGVGKLKILPGPGLLIVVGALAGLFGLSLLVPATRRLFSERAWPRFKQSLPPLIDALSQPLRLLTGIGGNLLLTVSYVVALLASLHAVGAHPAILGTAAIYMTGNTVGTAAPTPGGLGAVETVLAAGLTAIGIPAHQAVPAVLIFRAATFWLPILPGWAAYKYCTAKGLL
jgi:glycosyltransferase 2 family protein